MIKRKKVRKRAILAVLFCVAVLLFAVGFLWIWKSRTREPVISWKLESPVWYNEQLKRKIEEMAEEDLHCVLWRKRKNAVIENTDFQRTVQVDAYGIAGDSSILFPGGNVLPAGETGYCLLGTDTAYELFGSVEVTGRTVQIGDAVYQVAGVEFQKKEFCVYELSPEENRKVTHAACLYDSMRHRYMVKQRTEEKLINETGSTVTYPKNERQVK